MYLLALIFFQAVALSYGEYLQDKNRYQEAALMFEMCDQLERALEMYEKCGNWREAFCLTARLEYTPQNEMVLARKIAGKFDTSELYLGKNLDCTDVLLSLHWLQRCHFSGNFLKSGYFR